MSGHREPHIQIDGGRARVLCSTPGCGRKLLGEIGSDTKLLRGWVSYYCPRCKTTYRLTPEQPEPLRAAS